MVGKTLNHYKIVQSLGSGGMGEVYVAEDTKLNRKVALKVLPPELARDEERRRRFEQEAKVVATLNHPNIVTIYSVEEGDGVHFITMELVQGRSITESIPRDGMRLSQVLDLGIALADGVAAAHEQGITHRDLKPDNLMLSKDGRLKILDFGLAKITDTSVSSDVDSELPTKHMTAEGRLLGTVAYMSPEQAQGKPIDHRTDIFSLGTVLYEMVTAKLPFRGDNPAATLASIIKDEPRPPAELRQDLPPALSRMIRRCLAKDLRRRYQSALDLRNELEELKLDIASGIYLEPPGRALRPSSRWRLATVAALAAASVAAAVGFVLGHAALKGEPPSLDGNFFRITSHSAVDYHPNLSSDGDFVVYASKVSGNWDIYLQRVGGDKPINLTEDSPSDDTEPSLSADGEWIAFRSERSGGGIFVMGSTGENVRKVTDFGYNPSWSPDGTEIVCNIDSFPEPLDRTITPEHLWAVNVSTGEKRLLTSGDGVQGNWSPNGRWIAYWAVHKGGQRDIWMIPASGGEPVQVTRHSAVDWNPVWSPDGRYLYFVSDRGGSMNLWRVPVDEQTGHVQGKPEPVTTPSAYSQHPSFFVDGRRLAYVQLISRVHLAEVEFDAKNGNTAGPRRWVMQGPRLIKNPDLSANGEWFVFDSIDNKQEDLFVARLDGTVVSQITQDVYKDRAPRWSPDGEKIAFLSDRSGRYEAWTINPDGSGLEQITRTSEQRWAQAPLWSPDGTWIAVNLLASAPILLEVGKPWNQLTPGVASPGGDLDTAYFAWSWSPDGSKIAGAKDGIVVFDRETEQLEQLTDFGFRPIWLNDGRRLIFLHEDKIHLVDSSSGKATEVLSVAPHRLQSLGISKDNRRLYFSISMTEANIWLASIQ